VWGGEIVYLLLLSLLRSFCVGISSSSCPLPFLPLSNIGLGFLRLQTDCLLGLVHSAFSVQIAEYRLLRGVGYGYPPLC